MPIPPTYKPDDSNLSLPALHSLLTPEGQALLAEADTLIAQHKQHDSPTIARLRKTFSAEQLHAALTIAACDAKARHPKGKFPHNPTRVWATPEALEQATALAVAIHKTARFAQLPTAQTILDLCCGIGADTLALTQKFPAAAIDLSETRTFLATQNTRSTIHASRSTILTQDITTHPLPLASAFHIDPARRSAGRRSHEWADLIPSPSFLLSLLQKIPAGCIKLSPAVTFADLPPGHIELISHHRTTVQALLWIGPYSELFGPTSRSATIIDSATIPHTLTAIPDSPLDPIPPSTYLLEVDGAIHRAGLAPTLARQLNAPPLTPDQGLLTSASNPRSPFVTTFKILSTFPFSPRTLARHLPPGTIEFKPRAIQLNTDTLQKKHSSAPTPVYSLLIYPTFTGITATLAQRVL